MADEKMPQAGEPDRDQRLLAVREMITRSFPLYRYEGPITPVDGRWDVDLDEEEQLYLALKGKNWSEVPVAVIDQNPDGFVLLTDQAFPEFLPAWLCRALDAFEGRNQVRELLTYCFGGTDAAPPSDHVGRLLGALTRDQQETVRVVMQLVVAFESEPFIRSRARRAVEYIAETQGQ